MDLASMALVLGAIVGAVVFAGWRSTGPRVHERFDDEWRFLRADAPDAWAEDYDDSSWRLLDLPHDWSIEDLPPAEGTGLPTLDVCRGTWRFARGDAPSWGEADLDDTHWDEVALPAHWEDHSGYTDDNVYGWYRRRIEVPAELRGAEAILLLGKVDDVDETFVNGVEVGATGQFPPHYNTAWDKPRRYRIPPGILRGDGTDVVAVRVFDGEGGGGLYAEAPPAVRSGPFDSDAEGGGAVGYTVGGVGWYRKTFYVPEELQGRRVTIQFDGVYMNASLWLNGEHLGEHPYGYTSFQFDLTPHLQFGNRRNVLAVRVDASGKTSRWYAGSGIYRHVWATVTNHVCVEPWGVFVTTPRVSAEEALVQAETTVANHSDEPREVSVRQRVLDPAGRTVAESTSTVALAGEARAVCRQEMSVPQPALWSPDSPSLYRLVTSLACDGEAVDELETSFGVRSMTIDAARGLVLNGQPLKLRGGCVHHDNGCLGACALDRAEERRVELLKASGYNAIRTSHNPPSPAFLDACDRVGILVMDEAFDCWRQGKNPEDYHRFFDDWWQRDIAAMVLRDRNHPSVFCWSIGNEVPEQGSPEGAEIGAMLAEYVRSLDPTRPVGIGAHPGTSPWENLDPLFAVLDVCGYNYKDDRYAADHERLPDRVIAGTESFPAHCFEQWMATADAPYVIGDFVWTALDYLGESALGHTHLDGEPSQYAAWPWTVANCGDLDLTGTRRPQSYYRDVTWGTGTKLALFVHAPLPEGRREVVYGWGWPDERPSWTWAGHEGEPLTVNVYSRCERVRLTLNGRDLGTKETGRHTRFTATWEVPYEPGELVAIGLDGRGTEIARSALTTAAPPARVKLEPDRQVISADGQDLCFVTVSIVDRQGRLHPEASNLVRFSIEGPATIAGVGNGDPRSIESFKQPQRSAYRGLCQVVIRAGRYPGVVQLNAESDGLLSDALELRVEERSEGLALLGYR